MGTKFTELLFSILVLLPSSLVAGPIKVGLIAPMTGTFSFLGNGNRIGATIAADIVNEEGGISGRELRIIVEDSQGEPRLGISAFDKLVDLDKVTATLVALTSVSIAIQPISDEKKALIIADSNHPALVKGHPYTLRNLYSLSTLADEVVRFARSQGFQRMAVLHASEEWGEIGLSELSQRTHLVAHESFDKSSTDVMPQLVRIKAASPDVIFVLAIGSSAAIAYKQIRQSGIKAPIIGYEMCGQPENLESVRRSKEGKIYSISALHNSGSEEYKKLLVHYQRRFPSQVPSLEVMQAYDAVSILVNALRSGATTGEQLRSFIIRKQTFEGAVGPIEFTSDGDSIWRMEIRRVEDGKCV